jgi:hypothetical protein
LYQFILLAAVNLGSLATFAQERAGTLRLDEVYLEPTFISKEREGGRFGLNETSFSLSWNYQDSFRSVLSVGSLVERYTPQVYLSDDDVNEGFGVYEAFGEYQGIYGRVRFGLLPLNYGYGGYQNKRALVFPRPMIYEERVVARRDFGLSLSTQYNGYYTEIVAHNGELDEKARDGRIWTTANWGWTNENNLRVQLSMQVGQTGAEATTGPLTPGLAGFDYSQDALWRFADLSLHWFPRKWEVVLQASIGEREQGNDRGTLSANNLDVIHMFRPGLGLGLRYEVYDPDRDQDGDDITNTSIALVTGTAENTSRVFLIYNARSQGGSSAALDEFRLVWRLIPYF